MARLYNCFDRAATPRHHWNTRSFRELFGSNLVSQAPHDITARADEYNLQLTAEIRKMRMFSYESPSHPDCVGAHRCQRVLQALIIQLCASQMMRHSVFELCGPDQNRLIRLTHKAGKTVGFRVERNRANRRAIFVVEFAHSMYEAHRSIATIHNRDALKISLHRALLSGDRYEVHAATGCDDIMACSAFSRSGLIASDNAIV